MKKITSIAEYSTREQRRKRIGGIVIIVLLLLSTLGFALSIVGIGDNSTTVENTQGFSYNGQYWVYTAGLQQYHFLHHPNETNYSVQLTKNLADFSNKQVYVDSEVIGGAQEIANNLGLYSGKISEACYGECDRDLPEKNCTDPLIVIRESEIESVREEESCVFIEGNMKTIDAFLHRILGIN